MVTCDSHTRHAPHLTLNALAETDSDKDVNTAVTKRDRRRLHSIRSADKTMNKMEDNCMHSTCKAAMNVT